MESGWGIADDHRFLRAEDFLMFEASIVATSVRTADCVKSHLSASEIGLKGHSNSSERQACNAKDCGQ
jgi:hypothetical protein